MALVECKLCKKQVYVGVDKCPQCGVPNPGVSYEKEQEIREKQAAEDQLVNEIKRLGALKRAAYIRLDELEGQLLTGNEMLRLLRNLFPGAVRKAKIEEFQNKKDEIFALRGKMDELQKRVPSKRKSEIDHLWDIENTTRLSELRKVKK